MVLRLVLVLFILQFHDLLGDLPGEFLPVPDAVAVFLGVDRQAAAHKQSTESDQTDSRHAHNPFHVLPFLNCLDLIAASDASI